MTIATTAIETVDRFAEWRKNNAAAQRAVHDAALKANECIEIARSTKAVTIQPTTAVLCRI